MSWVPTRGGSSVPDRVPARVTYGTDVIVAEGPISKLRRSRSALDKGWNEWRGRFLVLQGPWLLCFSTTASPKRGAAAPWAAPLTAVMSVAHLDANTFTLTASGRKLTLRAPSPSDATRWVRIIAAQASARQRSQLHAAGGSVGLAESARPALYPPPTLPPRYSAIATAALPPPPPPPHRSGGGVSLARVGEAFPAPPPNAGAGGSEGGRAAPPLGMPSSTEPQPLSPPPSSGGGGGAPAQSAALSHLAPPPASGGRRRSIVAWGSSAALVEGQQQQLLLQQQGAPCAASAAGAGDIAFICEIVSPRDATAGAAPPRCDPPAPPPLPFKFSSHELAFKLSGHGESAASLSVTTVTQSIAGVGGGGGSSSGASGRRGASPSPRGSRAPPSPHDVPQPPPVSARSIFDTVSFAPLEVVRTGRGSWGERAKEKEGFAGIPRHWPRRLSQQHQQWGQPPARGPLGGSASSRASLPSSPPRHGHWNDTSGGGGRSVRSTAWQGGVPSGTRRKGEGGSGSGSAGRGSSEDCDDGCGGSDSSDSGSRGSVQQQQQQRRLARGARTSAALWYGGRTPAVSGPTPPSSDAATTPTCSSCGKLQALPPHPMPTLPDARPATATAAAHEAAAAAAGSSAAIPTSH